MALFFMSTAVSIENNQLISPAFRFSVTFTLIWPNGAEASTPK